MWFKNKPLFICLSHKNKSCPISVFLCTALTSVCLPCGTICCITTHITGLRWPMRPGFKVQPGQIIWVGFIAAYALRLKSGAGIEDSTVSSLNCDRWPDTEFRDVQYSLLLESLITDDVSAARVVSHKTVLFACITKVGPEVYDTRHARAGPPTVQWVLVTLEKQWL